MKNLFLTLATTFAFLTFVGCYETNTNGNVKTEKSAKCGDVKCGDAKKEIKAKCGAGKCGDGK